MAATSSTAAGRAAARTRLIINADDFGFTPSVTAGILAAHHAGSVTSTSMMVHCHGWDDAVRQAGTAPLLGIGLHLNLLVGAPLTAAASLTDRARGTYASLSEIVMRALTFRLDGAEVEAECEAQLQALRDAGITPTHIDSHRHTHALPVIRSAVARVAARARLPLRRPVESYRRFLFDVSSQIHRSVIATAWRTTSAGAPVTVAPDHFIGVSMQGGIKFAAQLTSVLDALPAGSTELMVHPGFDGEALQSVDGYTWQREVELEALTSPAVRERLGRGDIALLRFSDL